MMTSETQPLLIEIGCEEIPARFLAQAQKDLGDRVRVALQEARLRLPEKEFIALSFGERVDRDSGTGEGARHDQSQLQTYSTPRRLVSYVPAILERQPDKVEEITGPPVKVAVDAAGKYTRAAESFAQKNSATVDDLTRITTPKGEYLAVKKTTKGRPALDVLSEILPGVISGISFPKSMYWTGKSGPRFVRPIRWMLALLGEGSDARVVPFEIAGVKAGNFTFGHRTMGLEPVIISGFKDYVRKLHDLHVELDPEKRRERVEAECKALLEGSGLRVAEDRDLEDWIVNSTEWPRGLVGSFDARYLKLPREILVTVMRDHQKYFAVEDENGNLQPNFVTLLNVNADSEGIIRRGHERVLTARFSDAEFFWNADQKIPLRDRLPMLEKVTYQENLGSYGEKIRRMEAIAKEVCRTLEGIGKMTALGTDRTIRAIQLCKCDLTTQMVHEFTELQGVVGGVYAKAQGEPHEISDAIYDHYLPQGNQDKVPRSLSGAVVSLADKIDSVAAGFAAGMQPTGSSDPFGLRRAGNGVVRLLVEFAMPGSLRRSIESQLKDVADDVTTALLQFLEERVRHYMETERKLRYDTVRAVLGRRPLHEPAPLPWEHPVDAVKLAESLEAIRSSENFEALSAAARRIRNILKKSATDLDWQHGPIRQDLLIEPEEKKLSISREAAFWEVGELGAGGNYMAALKRISNLRPEVDQFFDKVLVMADDVAIRQNRLRLLGALDQLFSSIADLSQIESSASIPVGTPTSADSGN